LDDSVRQHRSWQGELVNRRKDGSVYETAVALTPIADRHGQHQGYVAVYRDITAHKELERLKSQFVSRIGHELRTPLSAIMLNLELLEYGKPERQAHYRQALTASAERLRQLIEAFFQMAKLDADLEQPDSLPVDLNRLVQDAVNEQLDRARQQGLTLDLKIDPAASLTPILSDPQWLRQVIMIVLDNALKYTSAPGTITVGTATHTETDRAWYTITIQDTGPGLTSEDLSRLFDRYFRGSAASQYTVPGTGLNLAIAQAIMSKLGGKITVESEHGHGAAFAIWIHL
jgi:two-component system phosphate regulon sensor histidine kinase PhoR